MRPALGIVLIATSGLIGVAAHRAAQSSDAASAAFSKAFTPWGDAATALAIWPDSLPDSLRGLLPADLEAGWAGWVHQRDREIRARLERGDEDALVNLWLYGTTFTRWPRVVESELARLSPGGTTAESLASARLEDLLDGLASPGTNERLRFGREVLAGRGLDPADRAGRERSRRALIEARTRVLTEFQGYERHIEAVRQDASETLSLQAVLFRDRGLALDTSVLVNFAVDRALHAIASDGPLQPRTVRRIAIVGPGLDFANKSDGHDFYPSQTIQPFAVMDSAIGTQLADAAQLQVTTLDVSARVHQHIERARERAEAGTGYLMHLTLPAHESWRTELVAFVKGFGRHIGRPVVPAPAPGTAGFLMVSAARVEPARVLAVQPHDLNVVLERFAPLDDANRFDLIIATNVLVYYGRFEQALALANVAAMLRPGGLLMTNTAVYPTPPFNASVHRLRVEYGNGQGDDIFWYTRE